jgi:hypothetical protein
MNANDYPNLAGLTEREFQFLFGFIRKHGVKGLLYAIKEYAEYNAQQGARTADQRASARRIAAGLNTLIKCEDTATDPRASGGLN